MFGRVTAADRHWTRIDVRCSSYVPRNGDTGRTKMRGEQTGVDGEDSAGSRSARRVAIERRTSVLTVELYRAPVTFPPGTTPSLGSSARRAEIEMKVWAPERRRPGQLSRGDPDVSGLRRPVAVEPEDPGRELRPTTRQQYRMLLDKFIYPTFGEMRIDRISAEDVNEWYDALAPGREAIRAQAYSLLRTIFNSCGVGATVSADPVQPGAHPRRRQHQARPQGAAGVAGGARDDRRRAAASLQD